MSAHRPTRRTLVAAVGGTVLTGVLAACSSDSGTSDAAQDLGYRSGDGNVTLFEPGEREEPVELSGETLDGSTWDSADHRGSVVLVNLWASWCGPCAKEAPHLVEIHEETKGEGGEVVGSDYREYPVE